MTGGPAEYQSIIRVLEIDQRKMNPLKLFKILLRKPWD